MKPAISLLLVSSALATAAITAGEFHVAPGGDDARPGTREQPFATFARAQQAVRSARAAQPGRPVTVTFQQGNYPLPATLKFDPADSGASTENPVVYRAAAGADVVISGGRTIGAWQPDPQRPGTWKTRAFDPATDPGARFEQLWVDGRRAIRARTPDWWQFNRLLGVDEVALPGQPKRFAHTFTVPPQDLAPLAELDPDALPDAQVIVFHKWDTTREFLASASPAGGTFTTHGSLMKHWNVMGRDCLYHFENFLAALDAPGEWFLARDGWLYYRPRDGEDMATAVVAAPRIDRLIEIRGDIGDPQKRVRHLRFEGLKFRHAGFRIPAAGLPPHQAGMISDATAIQVDGARDIRFDRCAVEHVGGTAIWFREACHDCRVERTRMFDLGVNGLRIGLTNYVDEPQRTARITVDNCIIHSGGRVLPCAVGVWIGHSSDNALTHCDVADFYYSAVSAGWSWGYNKSGAKRNRIEFNHLHHLGYRILSDMGAVYTLGLSEGTSISHNVIHDIDCTGYGGWGLYPDEGSTGILYQNNLVHDVRDGCFHQHYGRENVVRNNIFAFSRQGQVALSRAEPHLSFTFEHNLVYFDQGTLLGYNGWRSRPQVRMNHNLYWRTGGDVDFSGRTFAEWQAAGNDTDSLIADPLFVDAEKRDFRLRPDSPAHKVGFKPFDFGKAGVYGDDDWRQLAASTVFPAPLVLPPVAPLGVDDDFEHGTRTPLLQIATLSQESHDDLIRVTDRLAAAGRRCLELRRHPDLDKGFNPHLHWDPRFTGGVVRLSFQVRLEKGAALHCEWRDKDHPYRVGPTLMLRNGSLESRGKPLAGIPVDAWLGVTMECPVGQPGARWQATITLPDGSRQDFPDLPTDPAWAELRWLGFCLNGASQSGLFLDNVKLELR